MIVSWSPSIIKRVGLHYIAISGTPIEITALASRETVKIVEIADVVTNLG
jgi:hypothetical protein